MKIAVIPARGGSKRIPRKNIRPFAGKPMIAHSLIAARQAGIFDRIVVSSDDEEILRIGSEWGGEPMVRPAELADDHAGTFAVMGHAVRWIEEQGWNPTAVCCIYATSPFLEEEDLRLGYQRLTALNFDFAFAATSFGYPIFRGFVRDGEGVRMLYPEHFPSRSQDLPEVLHDAGQFYWGTPQAWLTGNLLFGPRSVPILLPRWRVQDIDTEEDWVRAELIHRALYAGAVASSPGTDTSHTGATGER